MVLYHNKKKEGVIWSPPDPPISKPDVRLNRVKETVSVISSSLFNYLENHLNSFKMFWTLCKVLNRCNKFEGKKNNVFPPILENANLNVSKIANIYVYKI